MRGKFITTSLRLAVLAASKTARKENDVKGNSSVPSFNVIWSKENIATKTKIKQKGDLPKALAV